MKSSEILNMAAEYIETGWRIFGCDAIRFAVNNGYWMPCGDDSPEYKKVFSYFLKYKPEVEAEEGFAWWPAGRHPERIAALRNAAVDAENEGD